MNFARPQECPAHASEASAARIQPVLRSGAVDRTAARPQTMLETHPTPSVDCGRAALLLYSRPPSHAPPGASDAEACEPLVRHGVAPQAHGAPWTQHSRGVASENAGGRSCVLSRTRDGAEPQVTPRVRPSLSTAHATRRSLSTDPVMPLHLQIVGSDLQNAMSPAQIATCFAQFAVECDKFKI